jgi:hypothetical protein
MAGRCDFYFFNFKFLEKDSSGGTKEIFLAEDMVTNRRVVLSFGLHSGDDAATILDMTFVDQAGGTAPAIQPMYQRPPQRG